MTELNELTIGEAKKGLSKKEFSAVELTESYIKKMEENRFLNAYVKETSEKALEQAKASQNKINSGNPIAIAEVVRDLYRKDNLAEQSYSERQIYEQALGRLANEYAVCHSISADEATKELIDVLAK